MPITMAIVLLSEDPVFSAAGVRDEFIRRWPKGPAPGDVEDNGGTFGFTVGSQNVICGLMPAPFPWSDLEGPCATSKFLKDGGQVLRTHKKHLILTASGDVTPIEQMRLLTQATAAFVAACPQAIGVFWTTAMLVIPPSLFLEFATEILPLGPPLPIWVDFRFFPSKAAPGKIAGFTKGLEALGHMELTTLNSPEPANELFDRFQGLVYYLLENGPVIKDGDTFGETAKERIKVKFVKSSFGHEKPVMRLEYPDEKNEPTYRLKSPLDWIEFVAYIAVTIGFGYWLHGACKGFLTNGIVRHLLLDLPILFIGLVIMAMYEKLVKNSIMKILKNNPSDQNESKS